MYMSFIVPLYVYFSSNIYLVFVVVVVVVAAAVVVFLVLFHFALMTFLSVIFVFLSFFVNLLKDYGYQEVYV